MNKCIDIGTRSGRREPSRVPSSVPTSGADKPSVSQTLRLIVFRGQVRTLFSSSARASATTSSAPLVRSSGRGTYRAPVLGPEAPSPTFRVRSRRPGQTRRRVPATDNLTVGRFTAPRKNKGETRAAYRGPGVARDKRITKPLFLRGFVPRGFLGADVARGREVTP